MLQKYKIMHNSQCIIVHHYSFLTEFTTFGSQLFFNFAAETLSKQEKCL